MMWWGCFPKLNKNYPHFLAFHHSPPAAGDGWGLCRWEAAAIRVSQWRSDRIRTRGRDINRSRPIRTAKERILRDGGKRQLATIPERPLVKEQVAASTANTTTGRTMIERKAANPTGIKAATTTRGISEKVVGPFLARPFINILDENININIESPWFNPKQVPFEKIQCQSIEYFLVQMLILLLLLLLLLFLSCPGFVQGLGFRV